MLQWNREQDRSIGGADLLMNGESVQGKMAFDISLVPTTGAAASQVVVARTTSLPSVEATELVKEPSRQIQQVLEARHRKKLRESSSLDFGGTFKPWIDSVGGTFHRETWNMLKQLQNVAPREQRD